MAKLQVPPVYSSNESFDMVSWFKLLWKWVTDLYTAEEVDDLIEANRVVIGTPVTTTSGTAHDYTGIPAGTRRITVNFSGISTNGQNPEIQLGDSGGVEATGYTGGGTHLVNGASVGAGNYGTGFLMFGTGVTGNLFYGTLHLNLLNSSTNLWVASGTYGRTDTASGGTFGGSKALSGELTTVRLTTTGGTATFDAGSVNITYER